LQSTQPRQILVVNDASTDRTAEAAREHGACVMNSHPPPEGWRGKRWACHQGTQAATGELLLFLDADTWFGPEGLARVLAD
jgi:4,4'-diaponeurosporenoate glycosyltransferase